MEEIFVSGQKSAVEFGIDLQRRCRWRDEDDENDENDEDDENDENDENDEDENDEDNEDENDDCLSKAEIENTT